MVLSFDADRTFRSISGEAVKDKDLKEILRGLHDSNPKQPMHIILHVLNEKAITFDDLGRALKKIESARSKDHDVIVFVHSSQLTK